MTLLKALARIRATMFMASGVLMFVSVILLGVERFDLADVGQAIIALPAMCAQIACLFGLIGLYPALTNARLLAGTGLAATLAAALIMIVSIGLAVGAGASPSSLNALAFAYTIAICLAFAFNGGAVLALDGFRGARSCLLFLPALIWLPIIVAGVTLGLRTALSLDFYTNAVVSVLLVALGSTLRKAWPVS